MANVVHPTATMATNAASRIQLATPAATKFGPCTMWFYPAGFAWARIQALHRQAQAATADRKHLAPARAATGYQNALIASMAQFAVISDTHRMRFFDHLMDAIAASKSFEGLATPFLSALNTAGLLHDTARIQRAATLWAAHGATAHAGTKLVRSYIVDGQSKTCTPLSAASLGKLAPGGANASLMAAGAIGHLALQVVGVGLMDTGVAQDGDVCKGLFKLGFGVVGAVLGGSAAGAATLGTTAVGGAVVGFGGGAVVGDIAGDLVCGHSTAPDAGAGGAGGAGTTGGTTTTTDPDDTDTTNDDNSTDSSQTSSDTSSQTSSQSSTDDNSTSGDSSGDNSGSGNDGTNGIPNPDDPGGFPNPDDPRGDVARTGSYLVSADFGSLLTHGSTGAWTMHQAPQLNAQMQLQTVGLMSAVPGFTATNIVAGSAQADIGNIATVAGLAAGVTGVTGVNVSQLGNAARGIAQP